MYDRVNSFKKCRHHHVVQLAVEECARDAVCLLMKAS